MTQVRPSRALPRQGQARSGCPGDLHPGQGGRTACRGAGRSLDTPPWGKPSVVGSRQDLAHYLPSPLPTALLLPQASPPCRTPQLDGDGPPSCAGCSGLCAGLSAVPASRHSESSSALLPAGPMKVPAAPEPVLHAEGAAQGGTAGMAAGTAPHAFSCPEDIVVPASAGPCVLSEANKS